MEIVRHENTDRTLTQKSVSIGGLYIFLIAPKYLFFEFFFFFLFFLNAFYICNTKEISNAIERNNSNLVMNYWPPLVL